MQRVTTLTRYDNDAADAEDACGDDDSDVDDCAAVTSPRLRHTHLPLHTFQ